MKIHSIKLQTAALEKTALFYGEILGLKRHVSLLRETYFQAGYSTLIFSEKQGFNGRYHFAFNIPCNQIGEAIYWLMQRDIASIPGPNGQALVDFPNWNAESTYFFDPAGNLVEFIARRDLNNASDLPFGPDALLGISEIAIVTKDVLAWNANTALDFGVLPFTKSSPGPDFSALGTDEGLFIVVPEGRKWFLTNIPATIEPLEVRFEQAGKTYTLN